MFNGIWLLLLLVVVMKIFRVSEINSQFSSGLERRWTSLGGQPSRHRYKLLGATTSHDGAQGVLLVVGQVRYRGLEDRDDNGNS